MEGVKKSTPGGEYELGAILFWISVLNEKWKTISKWLMFVYL
jgi:hypothetical protein